MKHLLYGVAVGLIGLTTTIAEAQTQREQMTVEEFKELSSKLLDAETKCWNAADRSAEDRKSIHNDYRAVHEELRLAFLYTSLNYRSQNEKLFDRIEIELDAFLYDCPPETRKEREARQLQTELLMDSGGADLSDAFFSRNWTATGSVSAAIQNTPQAGYGVEIVPGAEKFVAKSDDSLTGYFVGARISPSKNPWSFELEYADLDGNAEGQITNGTENVGIVYHDDTVGSTGVALGPRGLDVAVETEYVGASFLAQRRLTYSQRQFYAGMGILVTDTEHKSTVTTPSFVDISSESQQNIDETFFFLNANTVFPILPFNPNSGTFGFTITPGLEMGLRHAELASRQLNICGLCGTAEQNFTVDIEDDDFGFYYGGDIEALLGVKVSDRVAIGVRGNAWWRSHNAEIVNPETGDDLFIRNSPTHLETDDAYGASISAFITAPF